MSKLKKNLTKNDIALYLSKHPALIHFCKKLNFSIHHKPKNKTNMAKRKEEVKANYYQLVNGQIAKYCPEKTDFSKTVEKNGKFYEFEFFESIEGFVRSAYVYDKDLNDDRKMEELVLKLEYEGEMEVLQVPFNTAYAQSIIKRLENIDVSAPVEIKCYCIFDKEKSTEKGKDIYNKMILPYQNGKSIENPYKKDGKKMPEVIKKKIKGGKEFSYDFSELEEFFRQLVFSFNEKVKAYYSNSINEILN